MEALAQKPQSSLARPRLGFLGVGWIGRHRMQAMLETGAVEAAAIAEPHADMAAEATRLAPEAEVVGSLEDLLRADLDGVVIATPSALHAAQSIAALEKGIAVFCQKPLGRTAAEVEAVVAAARRADRLLGVDFSYRHTEAFRRIRESVRAGELGQIFGIDLVFHNAYGPDKPWFYDPALSGGGCLMDLGVHLVDLALWLLDFPEVTEASGHLFAGGEPLAANAGQVEDYAVATLTLGTGTVVRLATSWRLHAGRDAVITADVMGTKAGASFRNVDGSFYDFTAELNRGTARERLVSPPDAWGGRAAADWALRLVRDGRFDPEAERIVTVARVLDRLYGR
ncbi:Gfo/Idh/MocA family protein [Chelatococcus sp. GCM10030263]|uniref:Gfo/Idh/MocA family protein n=1 Tax=Chelatococcus sp. GCM10030263 TaxID=3273387 RepID=UPI00361F911E